jgi:hydrogenase/urease accessory protein HupE
MTRWLLLLFIVMWQPARAQADELKPGFLALREVQPKQWHMLWRAPIKGGMAAHVTPRFPLRCTMANERRVLRDDALIIEADLRCAGSLTGSLVGLEGLGETLSDALLRIAPLGRPVQIVRLTVAHPTALVAARASRWQVARTYLQLGTGHILHGFDHLLFVIALVLLLNGGWTLLRTVTAFTLAHSFTLIGVTLGVIGLPQRAVESVIALSILFLAVEIVKKRPETPRFSERFPWIVAFLFGLLHGFGFAGALAEIGLPQDDVPLALLMFNLGVEAGQLMIVGAALLALAAIVRVSHALDRPARIAAAYAIGIAASNWLIARVLL